MVRVAAAFGWGFAYLPGSADPWSPKAVRAGGGGQFQTPVSALDSIERLQEWVTAAAVVSGGVSPSQVPGRPIAVIIGEEAHGLDAAVIEAADHRVTIEMPGPTQSLNAAVAAGIVVHAMSAAPGHSAGGV
jgi:TrmH family RNA methyltransferase